MKAKEIRRSLVFLLLAAALLLVCWVVFDRKNTCDYTARIYGFFNEPEDSMEPGKVLPALDLIFSETISDVMAETES